MLPVILSTSDEGQKFIHSLSSRGLGLSSPHEDAVREILEAVRDRGDQAVVEYTRRFDAEEFSVDAIAVGHEEIEEAFQRVEPGFLHIIRKVIANVDEFHRRQVPNSWFMTRKDGSVLGQAVTPVDAAGLYVPGGTGGSTPLVSSVIMNGVPARIAGVERLVLATPPGRGNSISPHLLVTAAEIGIDEIYRMGSAWAVGAMAFGTETVKPVNVVVGPGNVFVTLAKKLVSGIVGIDMVAGPSEVLVVADHTPEPRHIAADLLSQAEHDPLATSVLVTTSMELATGVDMALDTLTTGLERSRIACKSLEDNGALIVVPDLSAAVDIVNSMGPEHLELAVADPWALLPEIRNAGAVFMGVHTPEPIGDYIAGPNHVLPTMGTAKFASALGVETFLKRSSIISYSREAFSRDADDVMGLAEIEGLTAHALSIRVRNE